MNKILIVDDVEAISLLYAEELKDEGYEVFTTNDYGGLNDIVEQQRPDLIVFDIRLGKVSDLDLLQDIRDADRNIPVIVCSAYPGFPSNMKSWVADFYIIKSADLSELKSKIRRAFENEMQLERQKYRPECYKLHHTT